MHAISRGRLASEISEERKARLHQVHDRLVSETTEEREARIQQMSVHQLIDCYLRLPRRGDQFKLQQVSVHHRDRQAFKTIAWSGTSGVILCALNLRNSSAISRSGSSHNGQLN